MKLLHLPPKNESNRKRVLACAKRSAWPSSTFFTGTLAFPDTIETIDNTTQTHNPDSHRPWRSLVPVKNKFWKKGTGLPIFFMPVASFVSPTNIFANY